MPENLYAIDNKDFQHLRELGFSEIDATRLIYMKNHMTEEIEYREMAEERRRLNFVRWLIEHNRLDE